MIYTVVLALGLCSSVAQVEPHPLVGRWKVSFPWHVDIRNGVATPVMESGELRVEERGDSLVATIVRSTEAQSKRDIRLAALKGPGETVFIARDKVTFSTGATQRDAIAVSTWILRPDGDRLRGTLERKLEGTGPPGAGPQPLGGVRIR
jgi:hypothetical protein